MTFLSDDNEIESLDMMDASEGSENTSTMQSLTEVPSVGRKDEKNGGTVPANTLAPAKVLTRRRPSKVLYSCIARGDTLLVNAGDVSVKDINYTIRHLLDRPHRLGWDIYSSDTYPTRKGIKFHIYQARDTGGFDVWVYAAVYNPKRTSRSTVQTFLMKLVILTETARLTELNWRHGDLLACQEEYERLLMQQMLLVRSLKASLLMSSTMALARIMILQNRELLNREEERKEAEKKGAPYQAQKPKVTKITSKLEVEVVSDSERTTYTDRDMMERDEAGLEREMGAPKQVKEMDEGLACGLSIGLTHSFDSAPTASVPVASPLEMASPTSIFSLKS
eukprot:scaffold1501_cov158-Amphora_coffeaeformis.AAC.15